MKSKHMKTFIALALGIAVLITAAFANYSTGTGYTVYKNALKNLLTRDKYEVSIDLSLTVDDEVQCAYTYGYAVDSEGEILTLSTSQDENAGYSSMNWEKRNPSDSPYRYSDYSMTNNNDGSFVRIYGYNNVNSILLGDTFGMDASDPSYSKIIKFVESAIDLMVGDLKNNFVYAGTKDGSESYRVILEGNQIPEIVTSGIELLYSSEYDSPNNSRYIYWADNVGGSLNSKVTDSYYEKAHDVLDEHNGGVVIICNGGEIKYFDNKAAYNLSEYYDREKDFNYYLSISSDSPVIERGECCLTVDNYGRLSANELSVTFGMNCADGIYHIITLTVDIRIDDLINGIQEPKIPANATITDRSFSTEANNYAYSVTENGVTTMYTGNNKSTTSDVNSEIEFITEISAYEQFDYLLTLIEGGPHNYDLSDPDDIAMAYSKLMVATNSSFNDYMEKFGISIEDMQKIINDAYSNLTTDTPVTTTYSATPEVDG